MSKVTLTDSQLEQLKEQYCELIVDGMDYKSMEQYIFDNMMEYFSKLTVDELEEEVYNHDEELWEELVDNVTQQYPKQNPTFHMDQAFNKAYKEV